MNDDRTKLQANLGELASLLDDIIALSPSLTTAELVEYLRSVSSSAVAVDVLLAASRSLQPATAPIPARKIR